MYRFRSASQSTSPFLISIGTSVRSSSLHVLPHWLSPTIYTPPLTPCPPLYLSMLVLNVLKSSTPTLYKWPFAPSCDVDVIAFLASTTRLSPLRLLCKFVRGCVPRCLSLFSLMSASFQNSCQRSVEDVFPLYGEGGNCSVRCRNTRAVMISCCWPLSLI